MIKIKYIPHKYQIYATDFIINNNVEAFEEEIVELLFSEIYNKINWDVKSEALDNELLEIQKDIFSKE